MSRRFWRNAAALALITALAAVFRFWRLADVPPGFHFDEAYEALEAWRVVTQPGYRPIFFPGNFGVEPMFIYLTSVAFRLFGESPAAMRGVAALIGTLTVPALFGLGRELALTDRRFPMAAAWLAAIALAVMRWHIIFSRVGIEPILVPLFLVLILWAFWRAIRVNHRGNWLLLGILGGLILYTYQVAWLFPLGALGVLGCIIVTKREFLAGCWRGLLLAGIVAAVITVPLGLNLIQHPDHLFLRTSQIAAEPGKPAAPNPVSNLLATAAMFSIRGDMDPRSNVPGLPAFDILMSLPFVIGLGLALWRWRRPVFSSLLIIGGVMLLPTVVSDYAPHFRRAVGATPVAALLIGLGLAVILGRPQERASQDAYVPWRVRESGLEPAELSARMDRLRWFGRMLVVVVIVAGSAIYGAVAYFDIWGRANALYYAYDQGLWEIGQYVRGLPADERVLLSPRPETDMTLAFALRDGPAVRRFDGRHAFVVPGDDRPATYIIIDHEDDRGRLLLRDLYPDAKEAQVFLDRNGRLYAQAFRVPSPGTPVRKPQTPVTARWPGISLVGYDIDRTTFQPGQKVYLQLWWRADASPATDWTVFTHVLGPAKPDGSTVWAGLDGQPGQGSAPTRTWMPGDLILDEYQIQLPAEMPAGQYQIEVGLYDPKTGGIRAKMLAPEAEDHMMLGKIQVQ
ncbi:MAG: glycosyltransferase family 39 protein [Anaerolineae bacterium]|nr:glycosyltransferase family 39 protein [Anaerolineae bacterium]